MILPRRCFHDAFDKMAEYVSQLQQPLMWCTFARISLALLDFFAHSLAFAVSWWSGVVVVVVSWSSPRAFVCVC